MRPSPVPPVVDVEVGHDDGVEGARLRRPPQHGLEPGGVRRQPHAGEGPDRLVGEVERESGSLVHHVRDELVAHEDVVQQGAQGVLTVLARHQVRRLRAKQGRAFLVQFGLH